MRSSLSPSVRSFVLHPLPFLRAVRTPLAPPLRSLSTKQNRWEESLSPTGTLSTRPAGWPTMLPTSTLRSCGRRGLPGGRRNPPRPAASCCIGWKASSTSGWLVVVGDAGAGAVVFVLRVRVCLWLSFFIFVLITVFFFFFLALFFHVFAYSAFFTLFFVGRAFFFPCFCFIPIDYFSWLLVCVSSFIFVSFVLVWCVFLVCFSLCVFHPCFFVVVKSEMYVFSSAPTGRGSLKF